MNKELEQLKLQRKRTWKKIENCYRGYRRVFRKYYLYKNPNLLKRLYSKMEKYSIYLELFLLQAQRIKELENV